MNGPGAFALLRHQPVLLWQSGRDIPQTRSGAGESVNHSLNDDSNFGIEQVNRKK